MKIAIPLTNGVVSSHFGHCEQFALITADEKDKTISESLLLTPPPHEPGLLPAWLAEQGAHVILAGGIGNRACQLFAAQAIKVVMGVPSKAPAELVQDYLDGTLVSGPNACDH